MQSYQQTRPFPVAVQQVPLHHYWSASGCVSQVEYEPQRLVNGLHLLWADYCLPG